jgi:hypothetical protein
MRTPLVAADDVARLAYVVRSYARNKWIANIG